MLNSKYTFDSFVIGDCNKFAYSAALNFAEANSNIYSPLFIYGNNGLGKTHLLNAIKHFLIQNSPNLKIELITTEGFCNELLDSMNNDCYNEFRDKYCRVDVLLVEDIQFLKGLERTQEHFIGILNELIENSKRVVITANYALDYLEQSLGFSHGFRSVFESGVIVEVKPPDYETSLKFLRKKSDCEGINISDNVVELIPDMVANNFGRLEGLLRRIFMRSELGMGIE